MAPSSPAAEPGTRAGCTLLQIRYMPEEAGIALAGALRANATLQFFTLLQIRDMS